MSPRWTEQTTSRCPSAVSRNGQLRSRICGPSSAVTASGANPISSSSAHELLVRGLRIGTTERGWPLGEVAAPSLPGTSPQRRRVVEFRRQGSWRGSRRAGGSCAGRSGHCRGGRHRGCEGGRAARDPPPPAPRTQPRPARQGETAPCSDVGARGWPPRSRRAAGRRPAARREPGTGSRSAGEPCRGRRAGTREQPWRDLLTNRLVETIPRSSQRSPPAHVRPAGKREPRPPALVFTKQFSTK